MKFNSNKLHYNLFDSVYVSIIVLFINGQDIVIILIFPNFYVYQD